MRKRENKNYRSVPFLPKALQKIPKKIAKKLKKLKDTIVVSFRAKLGWKRPRKNKNKSYRSVSFQPDAKYIISKKQLKNSKYKTIPLWLHFKPKSDGKGCEREKIKIIVPFRSYPTPNIKTPKQLAKKLKKLKNTNMASFRAKIGWKMKRKSENKNYRSVSFRPKA